MAKSKRVTAVKFQSGEVYEYRAMWDDQIADGSCTALYGKEGEAALHEYRRRQLLDIIKPGQRIKTVCVHSTRNGVAHYRLFIVGRYGANGDSFVQDITDAVAKLNGHRVSDKTQGIVMSGWGYSKSFQIVYWLGLALWPNGTPVPHGMRNGEPDSNGGYALKAD